jgi:hypothetical protein
VDAEETLSSSEEPEEPGTDGKFPIFLRARLYRIEISFQRPKPVVLDDPALFRDAHLFAALDGGASLALRSG